MCTGLEQDVFQLEKVYGQLLNKAVIKLSLMHLLGEVEVWNWG